MTDYGSTPPPPPPPPPGGQNPYGVPAPGEPTGYGAPEGYNAPPPPAGGLPSQGGAELSSWGLRVGGYLIDALLLIPGYILYIIGAPKSFSYSTDVNGQVSSGSGAAGGNGLILFLGIIVILAITAWNRWYKGGTTGQTVGRGVVGTKVVDANTGQPIGPLKAFVRDLAHIVDSIICGLPIGWLAPLWDAKKQTWGDKIMSTVSVRVPK